MSLRAVLSDGQIYALNFVDVDGRTLSTADGHVTVLVLATTADAEKARAVGDRAPDYCLGNPSYRMITILHFAKKHTALGQKIAAVLFRHRLNEEAKHLQARYDAKKIARDARRDIFASQILMGRRPRSSAPKRAPRVFVFSSSAEMGNC